MSETAIEAPLIRDWGYVFSIFVYKEVSEWFTIFRIVIFSVNFSTQNRWRCVKSLSEALHRHGLAAAASNSFTADLTLAKPLYIFSPLWWHKSRRLFLFCPPFDPLQPFWILKLIITNDVLYFRCCFALVKFHVYDLEIWLCRRPNIYAKEASTSHSEKLVLPSVAVRTDVHSLCFLWSTLSRLSLNREYSTLLANHRFCSIPSRGGAEIYGFRTRGFSSQAEIAAKAGARRAKLTWESQTAGKKKSEAMLMYLVAMVTAMVGITYAAVPLYRKFCQATGYGGTVQRKEVWDIKNIITRGSVTLVLYFFFIFLAFKGSVILAAIKIMLAEVHTLNASVWWLSTKPLDY